MRTLLAFAIIAGGMFVLHAPADAARKRSVKPHQATAQQRANWAREQAECERARHEDRVGLYVGYPCWAREAFAKGKNREW